MIQLTEEMKDSINTARTSGYPCIVSTASKDGVPNSGYIGTMMALDDSSLAFRDRGGGGSLVHLEENPKVIISTGTPPANWDGNSAAPPPFTGKVRTWNGWNRGW